MVQNEVTDAVSAIDSLWAGSQISIPYIPEVPQESVYGGNFLIYSILFFICFLLLFRRNTYLFFLDVLSQIKTPVRYSYQEGLHKTRNRIYIATYIMLPVLSYLIASYGLFPEWSYWHILLMVSGFLLVQYAVNSIIEYVSSDTHIAGFMNMSYSLMSITTTIVLFVAKIFTLFFTISQTGLLSVILYIILGLVALVYCINILRIFFSFKTSHFFSFLYLCTLELIPLMIIFKMVLS